MKTVEQMLRQASDERRDGLDDVRKRIHREIAAEKRRKQFVFKSIPRPVRAAAAMAAAGLGTYFLWQAIHPHRSLPPCPHSASSEETERFIASGHAIPEDFILNPERYDRICHCSPRYSGSMR